MVLRILSRKVRNSRKVRVRSEETCSGESQRATDTGRVSLEQRPRREPGPGV